MKRLLTIFIASVLPLVALADDPAPTPEKLTSQQVKDAKVQWKKQASENKTRLQNRATRAKANSQALMAAPGTPLKRPYYGDNAGNPVHHH